MALGPLVRAEDAGLACPDWPLCHGHVVPPYEYGVYLEFIHRVVAGALGLVFLVWFYLVFKQAELRARFRYSALSGLLLLALQVYLGRSTITEELDAYVIKSHLLNAMLFWSVLLSVHFRLKHAEKGMVENRKALLSVASLFLACVFLQLFLGGRVSANEAGLACTAFPSCYLQKSMDETGNTRWEGVYFPPMTGHVEKHMTHRFMGYFILLFSLATLLWARRAGLSLQFRRNANLVFSLVVLQILLGGLNVVYHLPVLVTVAHSALAISIYGVVFMNWHRILSSA